MLLGPGTALLDELPRQGAVVSPYTEELGMTLIMTTVVVTSLCDIRNTGEVSHFRYALLKATLRGNLLVRSYTDQHGLA